MTQDDKELLLRDLCARLPYGVMIDYESHIYILNEIDPACKDIDYITVRIQDVERLMCAESVIIEDIKPFLRPMSSMTEEESDELESITFPLMKKDWDGNENPACIRWVDVPKYMDFILSHHFDYNGLIPKGLAIEVTEKNNPYKE